jgi:ribosomal protein S18 acetylase RimI-like enzyme
MTTHHSIHQITAKEVAQHGQQLTAELAQVLIACVEGGASVSFMHPLSQEKAQGFWEVVLESAKRNERILLVTRDDQQRLVGTVQLITALPDNQPHRGDVAKMLVHPDARQQGLGQALMQEIESHAKQAGKTLLVLDTVTHSAGWRLYQRCGWQIAGDIPNYALLPQGGLVATTYMYKSLN